MTYLFPGALRTPNIISDRYSVNLVPFKEFAAISDTGAGGVVRYPPLLAVTKYMERNIPVVNAFQYAILRENCCLVMNVCDSEQKKAYRYWQRHWYSMSVRSLAQIPKYCGLINMLLVTVSKTLNH